MISVLIFLLLGGATRLALGQSTAMPAQSGPLSGEPATAPNVPPETGLVAPDAHQDGDDPANVQTVEKFDPVQAGKKVMDEKCSSCHPVPRPRTHTLAEWPVVVNEMAGRAFLRPDEQALIMSYLRESLRPHHKHFQEATGSGAPSPNVAP
jgi:hypothetical protein